MKKTTLRDTLNQFKQTETQNSVEETLPKRKDNVFYKKRQTEASSKDYLNNFKLYQLLVERLTADEKRVKEIDDYFVLACEKLTRKILNRSMFYQPEIFNNKDDIVSDALLQAIIKKSWTKFDTSKNDAVFSYLTTVMTNFILKTLAKYNIQNEIKAKMKTTVMIQFETENCKYGINSKKFFSQKDDESK